MLRKITLVAALVAALAAAGEAGASQATLVTPGSPLPMTSLATFLNAAYLSIGSCNSGTSAPANGPGSVAFQGECWLNTSSSPWVLSVYDGANWVEVGTINSTSHAFTLPLSELPSIGAGTILGNATASTGAVTATYTASNTSDTTVVLAHSTITSGHCPQFSDAHGTITDSGAPCAGSGAALVVTAINFGGI